MNIMEVNSLRLGGSQLSITNGLSHISHDRLVKVGKIIFYYNTRQY